MWSRWIVGLTCQRCTRVPTDINQLRCSLYFSLCLCRSLSLSLATGRCCSILEVPWTKSVGNKIKRQKQKQNTSNKRLLRNFTTKDRKTSYTVSFLLCMYIYIYIYICVCVYVCVYVWGCNGHSDVWGPNCWVKDIICWTT